MGLCLSTAKAEPQYSQEDAPKKSNKKNKSNTKEFSKTPQTQKILTTYNPELSKQYLEQGLNITLDKDKDLEIQKEAIQNKLDAYINALEYDISNLRAKFGVAYVNNFKYQKQLDHDPDILSPDFLKVINEIITLPAHTEDDYIAKSRAYRELNQLENEVLMGEKAAQIKNTPDLYIEIGELYQKLKQWEKAEELYKTGIELSQDQVEADTLCNYAIVLSELKKFDEAIKIGYEAIKLAPEAPVLYYNLGNDCVYKAEETGDKSYYEKAIENYGKAISFDPYDPIYPCSYGQTLFRRNKQGDATEALEYLNKAFELYQDSANHKNFTTDLHTGIQLTFSMDRAYLLKNLKALTEATVEVIVEGESAASQKDIDEYNKNAVKLTQKQEELRVKAIDTLGPESTASGEEVNGVNNSMTLLMKEFAAMKADYAKLTQIVKETSRENASLKKKIDSKADLTAVSYAVQMNFEWKNTAEKIQQIELDADPVTGGKKAYYHAFVSTLDCAWIAYSAVNNQSVSFDIDTSNMAVTAASVAAKSLPFIGEVAGSVIKGAHNAFSKAGIKKDGANIAKVASTVGQFEAAVCMIGRHAATNPVKVQEIKFSAKTVKAKGFWESCVSMVNSLGESYKSLT